MSEERLDIKAVITPHPYPPGLRACAVARHYEMDQPV